MIIIIILIWSNIIYYNFKIKNIYFLENLIRIVQSYDKKIIYWKKKYIFLLKSKILLKKYMFFKIIFF